MIGQIGGRLVVVIDDTPALCRCCKIGGLQVGKIDAAKRLVLAAHRLRVVQRRADQVVEVMSSMSNALRICAQPAPTSSIQELTRRREHQPATSSQLSAPLRQGFFFTDC